MIRVLVPIVLAISLVLSSLGAVVAQTRMATAGGYCGTGAPQIVLDALGLPILDADGAAIAAPDCPACTLTLAPASAPRPITFGTTLRPVAVAPQPSPFLLETAPRTHQARAPPAVT